MNKADNKELEEAIKRLTIHKNPPIILGYNIVSEKDINTILNYIDNSISKEKVEKVIEELEDKAKRIAGTYQYSDSAEDLENKKTEVRLYRTVSEDLQKLLKGE